jgi:hypothetical protein
VGEARLTCGRPSGQTPFAQLSPKREDLTRFTQVEGCAGAQAKEPRFLQEPNKEPNGYQRDVAESRPRRGHGEDSIYYDQANHCWVAAVSLGYKGGKRVRRKVTGRTKTEVRTKLRGPAPRPGQRRQD